MGTAIDDAEGKKKTWFKIKSARLVTAASVVECRGIKG